MSLQEKFDKLLTELGEEVEKRVLAESKLTAAVELLRKANRAILFPCVADSPEGLQIDKSIEDFMKEVDKEEVRLRS